ncbi:hypothetical protein [Polyangium jinanense]|uniref:Uncharacterized protein n=1 Tax=Polyangium jinanense TaxID=2829994 RepID=A0A9X3XGS2_9BACT|nr:hypothetical protein [Polyangium jinanense]MDC3959031.1 hypothetical protein [Polyangium jinanense]MDC3989205.1 hypothetical protein [Polyangium jinanense]
MTELGIAIYAACVDFMIRAAALAGATYRDANAFMFFALWPAVTVVLLAVVAWQAVVLRRLRRRR